MPYVTTVISDVLVLTLMCKKLDFARNSIVMLLYANVLSLKFSILNRPLKISKLRKEFMKRSHLPAGLMAEEATPASPAKGRDTPEQAPIISEMSPYSPMLAELQSVSAVIHTIKLRSA